MKIEIMWRSQSMLVPTTEQLEGKFTIGQVTFDQRDGLGEVPNNRNVIYLGFAAYMWSNKFLACASRADRNDDAARILERVRLGDTIASPWLDLDLTPLEDGRPARITGHEGRARATACQMLQPEHPVLVHIFPRYHRARHLSGKLLTRINSMGVIGQNNNLVARPFDAMFLNDEVYQ